MTEVERIAVLEATVSRLESELKKLREGAIKGFEVCDKNFASIRGQRPIYTDRPGFMERVLGW